MNKNYLTKNWEDVLKIRVNQESYITRITKSIAYATVNNKLRFLKQTLESMYLSEITESDLSMFFNELTKSGTNLLEQLNKFMNMYKKNYLSGFTPYIR